MLVLAVSITGITLMGMQVINCRRITALERAHAEEQRRELAELQAIMNKAVGDATRNHRSSPAPVRAKRHLRLYRGGVGCAIIGAILGAARFARRGATDTAAVVATASVATAGVIIAEVPHIEDVHPEPTASQPDELGGYPASVATTAATPRNPRPTGPTTATTSPSPAPTTTTAPAPTTSPAPQDPEHTKHTRPAEPTHGRGRGHDHTELPAAASAAQGPRHAKPKQPRGRGLSIGQTAVPRPVHPDHPVR